MDKKEIRELRNEDILVDVIESQRAKSEFWGFVDEEKEEYRSEAIRQLNNK